MHPRGVHGYLLLGKSSRNSGAKKSKFENRTPSPGKSCDFYRISQGNRLRKLGGGGGGGEDGILKCTIFTSGGKNVNYIGDNRRIILPKIR